MSTEIAFHKISRTEILNIRSPSYQKYKVFEEPTMHVRHLIEATQQWPLLTLLHLFSRSLSLSPFVYSSPRRTLPRFWIFCIQTYIWTRKEKLGLTTLLPPKIISGSQNVWDRNLGVPNWNGVCALLESEVPLCYTRYYKSNQLYLKL